jgi:thymidylate synthase ThyX
MADADHDVSFRSDVTVELVRAAARDADVLFAARVSTRRRPRPPATVRRASRSVGLIRFLMRDRHGSPFEHNSMTFYIQAPIFVWREFMRHRIGFCLAGSSLVPVGGLKNGVTKSIADIYRDWHEGVGDSSGRTRHLPSCRNPVTRTLNLETGLIEFTRMVDVFKAGVKPVIDVFLASRHRVRCTPEHRIWTPDGWVKAGDLTINDLVGRQGKVPTGSSEGIPRRLRMGIQEWTTQQRPERIAPVDTCHVCGNLFAREDLELAHVIPVSQNLQRALDPENLAPICSPCHAAKSGVESWEDRSRRRPLALGVRFERVVAIRDAGSEMTYDIEMPGPWHNFIADGIVVHNSYNEESGRYRKLRPVFYVPGPERRLVQEGKPGAYTFVDGSPEQHKIVVEATQQACRQAYAAYLEMLGAGVAREVARIVLPVTTYSSAYVTVNARSLMNFLSLRTKREDSTFPSFPQREIEMVAEKMETHWAGLMPLTHEAFCAGGRVPP